VKEVLSSHGVDTHWWLHMLEKMMSNECLRQLQVLAIDELGQIPAEGLSILDAVLHGARNWGTQSMMGGVLVFSTVGAMQFHGGLASQMNPRQWECGTGAKLRVPWVNHAAATVKQEISFLSIQMTTTIPLLAHLLCAWVFEAEFLRCDVFSITAAALVRAQLDLLHQFIANGSNFRHKKGGFF